MSFFGGHKSDVKPSYTGLQLQTASSILALTMAWGANRFAPNLIWYDDFQSHKHKQKAGKGGGSITSYTYSASCMLSLCEGAINGIGKVYKSQDTTSSLADLGMSLFTGTVPQAAWGYLTSKHPSVARDYPGVAYLAAANYDLGESATLPNHSFEVYARQYSTCKDGSKDADPAIIIDEFLTTSAFGVGMPQSNIDYSTLYSSVNATTTGDAAFQTYCAAQGFGLSPVLSEPNAANDTLDKWTKMCNTAVVWTGYVLKFIPYDLSDIDGNGYKYRPTRTVVYTLTDSDFVSDPQIDPVIATRTDPSDAYNSLKITIKDRDNDYNSAPVEWKDQGLIDQFGLRPASTFQADEITRLDMASKVVAIMGQRGAYVRNSYAFTLGPSFCLLEPMDLIEIIDAKLGTVLLQVTKIDESEDTNDIDVVADEISIETTSSIGFTPSSVTSGGFNSGSLPGPVNPPLIFDVPADLSNGVAQVWAAVSGGNGTVYNQYWGGAVVYVSRDNITYDVIGTIDSPARQGKTTAALAAYAGTNPDTVHTLPVSLAMSNGELISVSPTDAANGATLCYVDGEFISFEDATLTGTNLYTLENLYRGLYRTTPGAHLINKPFARLDDNIFKYTLPPENIGIPLYFKFQSFNIWGQASEDVSTLAVYNYTPTGLGFEIAPPASTGLTFASRVQADGTNIIQGTVAITASPGPYLDHYDVQITVSPYTAWTDLPKISAGSTTTIFEPALPGINYKARARAVSSAVGGIPSAWVTTGVVASGSLATTAPSVPTGLATSGSLFSNKLTWVAGVGGGTPSGYKIYAINAPTGVFSSATLIGTSSTPFFTHTGLGSSDTWRYWVTAYNFVAESAEDGPVNSTTSSGTGGTFISLSDVPASYTGAANKWVRVNSTPNGLEFFTPTFRMLSDVPSSYTGQALKAVRVNAGASALEFYTPVTSFVVKYNGTSTVNPATNLNFTGEGVTVTDAGGGQANINIANAGKIYAPLVNGDLPGPVAIATDDGQFMMVEIS